MANRVQHLRGSLTEHSTFTGEKGEISLVTDTSANRIPTGELRIHDGSTAGGLEVPGVARAWVNFNGTLDENSGSLTAGENVLIRASFNVSSVYYNGTGDYTVNFANDMPDTNYCAFITADDPPSSNNFMSVGQVVSKGFNNIRFETHASHNYTNYDMPNANVAIFR